MSQAVDTFLPSRTYNVRFKFRGGSKVYEWLGVHVKQDGYFIVLTTQDGTSHKYHTYGIIERHFELCPLEETSSTLVGKEAAAGQ